MLSAFDISASALEAQRVRLNAISNNMANMSTTRNEDGQIEAYQPRFVVFQTDDSKSGANGAVGVKVASVETSDLAPKLRYMPNHPDANEDGYVSYPNINMMSEMVDAMETIRAYEANIGVIEITNNMSQQTLRILA